MDIRIISDLHLEFAMNADYTLPHLPNDSRATLVIAGDIAPIVAAKKIYQDFILSCATMFKYVVVIAGNHEFYRGDVVHDHVYIKRWFDGIGNAFYLNDDIVVLDDVLFVGAVLWTSLDNRAPHVEWKVSYQMNDMSVIEFDSMEFTCDHWYDMHTTSVDCITSALKVNNNEKKCVVVTHHAPSFESVNQKYRLNGLNAGYASNLESLILRYQPTIWIHGHMHDSVDYTIEDTRVICNPRGYYGYELNHSFDPLLTVTI